MGKYKGELEIVNVYLEGSLGGIFSIIQKSITKDTMMRFQLRKLNLLAIVLKIYVIQFVLIAWQYSITRTNPCTSEFDKLDRKKRFSLFSFMNVNSALLFRKLIVIEFFPDYS